MQTNKKNHSKSCFSVKKLNLTSERHVEHPFAGRNTQQMSSIIFNKKFNFLIKHMSGRVYMSNSLGKDKQAMSWFKYQLIIGLSELQQKRQKYWIV